MKHLIKITLTILLVCTIEVSAGVKPDGNHPVCSNIKYASKDYAFYKNVYGSSYHKLAAEVYTYALMSSNVYEDYKTNKPKFNIPGWNQIGEKQTTWKGFGAHIYESEGVFKKVVIAFEGTNPTSLPDWAFGNLNLYWKGQYQDAENLVNKVVKKYGENVEIFTTGHSLGGGLAIHAALHHKNVKAIAFNSSPRIFNPQKLEISKNKITLVSENKDILKVLRDKWPALKDVPIRGAFNEFDFLNETLLNEHSVYYIARGLMIVAAASDDFVAKSIIYSFSSPETKCRV